MPDPSEAGVAGLMGVIGAGVMGYRLEFDGGACEPILEAGVNPGVTLPGGALLPSMLGVPGEAVWYPVDTIGENSGPGGVD